MSKKLVVGNWKMNPATLGEARRIAGRTRRIAATLEHTEVAVCPPFVFVAAAASRNKSPNYSLGAQSVSYEESGAHTGEVSAAMLRDLGAEYVIIGHSEERARGDSDEIVSRRISAAVLGGLTAIVCVGEKTRDEGGAYLEALKQQIKNSFATVPAAKARNIIIAYEPVWAIGAKEAMQPEQVYEMSLFVKKVFADVFGPEAALKAKVLYGGSVNFRNAGEIINTGKVDGLLVGRESVNMPGFSELLRAVDKI